MKRVIALLTALIMVLCLVSCSQPPSREGYAIYYSVSPETQGQSALGAERWNPDSGDMTAAALFARMCEAPSDDTLSCLIPASVRLLSATEEDGNLTLDLSESFGSLSGIAMTRACYGIVLTMTQLPRVRSVTITVEGKLPPDVPDEILLPEQVLLSGEVQDPTSIETNLYFPNRDGTALCIEYRRLEVHSLTTENQVHAVLRALVVGPSDPAALPCFDGLEVALDCSLAESSCVLTLSEGWAALLSSDEQARLALVNSLCELEHIDSVVFRWSGTEEDAISGTFYPQYS